MQHKRKRGKEENVGEEGSVAGTGTIKRDRICSLVDISIEDYEIPTEKLRQATAGKSTDAFTSQQSA